MIGIQKPGVMRLSMLFGIWVLGGIISFGVRRLFILPEPLESVLDGLGTMAWSGCLTVAIVSFLNLFKKIEKRTLLISTLVFSLVISIGVEFLQLTSILSGFPENIFIHLIFGSIFSWFDIPFYVAGVFVSCLILFTEPLNTKN